MKHTPGPWKIDDNDELPLGVIQDNEMGLGICTIDCADPEMSASEATGEMKANARLIAEAPDLLEICKQAAEWYHGSAGQGPICDEDNLCVYCEAISKAEGK